MVAYEFYRNDYRGDSIPVGEFPRLAARAGEQLALYKRTYRVSAPAGAENAEEMALCAMADALYYYDLALAGEASSAGVSVGSVSSSRAPGAAPDLSLRGQAAELYRCARAYLVIERWC